MTVSCAARRARSGGTIRRAICCSSTARWLRKSREDGRALVEIEQIAHNQDGDVSVIGTGVVELPTRLAGQQENGLPPGSSSASKTPL